MKGVIKLKIKEDKISFSLVGKIDDVCDFLKSCEENFVYVKDLIEALNRINNGKYLN